MTNPLEQKVNGQTILIVDDERAIREMTALALQQAGYRYLEASNAHEAELAIRENNPDLMLLDWMMPGLSGAEFARRLRRQEETRTLPIIMVTAKTEEEDIILGLASGADDYIAKPFSTGELVARIRALLRRVSNSNDGEILSHAGLVLDTSSHRVKAGEVEFGLGPTEFRLLKFFMENPERVYSREQVLNNVWGDNVFIEDRTVDVHIRRLRKALESSGHDKLVQTVRGTGYRFSSIL